MSSSCDNLGVETLLAHFGEEKKICGAVVAPIFQNSLFLFDRAEELMAAMTDHPADPPYHYSRLGNPTVEVVEHKLAALEGTEACKVTGGGISALTIAMMSELESGSHAIAVDTAYGPARNFLSFMSRFGVETTFVEGSDAGEVIGAMKNTTRLLYLESPSSLLFRLQDVPAITAEAARRGITTLFDNTYNTPLHMRPAEFGIDIVCHSASKYLGGHSDINAGAICTDRKRMDKIIRNELNYYAGLLHPFSAWLMLRGMRTLAIRLKQHEETANHIAAWLETRQEVARVLHISLPSFPQRDLYNKLMTGSGGLFSFEPVKQSREAAFAFADSLRLFGTGISWGGFESLVVPVHVEVSPGNHRWLIRLFCGLEAVPDLTADLEQALKTLA